MHALVLTLLCLIASKQVLGLKCYATDVQKLRQGTVQDRPADCADNLREALAMTGSQLGEGPPDSLLRCYKVTLYGSKTISVKGCLVNGGCEVMKQTFQSMGLADRATTTCDECEGNYCNTAAAKSVSVAAAMLVAAAVFVL